MIIDPDSLVECYDSIAANAPASELEAFFSDHSFSPDDWFAWPGGVEVYMPVKTRTWKADERVVWDTLRGTFSTVFQHKRVDDDDLIERPVNRYRRKDYIRQGDIEIWVECPEERVSVSNQGRVRSHAKSGHILTPHRGGKVSGPWVSVYGRTVYVNDLIRKYIVSVPGMV